MVWQGWWGFLFLRAFLVLDLVELGLFLMGCHLQERQEWTDGTFC